MTHLEGNKIIAEFMGGKLSNESMLNIEKDECWLPFHGICRWDTIDYGKGKILEYHSSWDWLMPVVEKIENIEIKNNFYEVLIASHFCSIKLHSEQDWLFLSTGDLECNSTIDAVWQTVIKFIQTQLK